MDEFLCCYKPSEINQYLGFYKFSARVSSCRMIRALPLSDRLWKREFFFVSGFCAGNPVEVGKDTFLLYVSAMARLRSEGIFLTLARLNYLIIFV